MRRALLFAIVVLILSACAQEPEYDIVLRNGTIYDGSGAAPVQGDIAIRGDRIAAVGDIGSGRGREEIDVNGVAVLKDGEHHGSHAGAGGARVGTAVMEVRLEECFFPLLRGGSAAPIKHITLPLVIGAAGEVSHFGLQERV